MSQRVRIEPDWAVLAEEHSDTAELITQARSLKGQGFTVKAIGEMLGVPKDYAYELLQAAPKLDIEVPFPELVNGRMERIEEERTCTHPGCGTTLCGYNDGPECWIHAGWDEASLIEASGGMDFEQLFYWIANEEYSPTPGVEVMT